MEIEDTNKLHKVIMTLLHDAKVPAAVITLVHKDSAEPNVFYHSDSFLGTDDELYQLGRNIGDKCFDVYEDKDYLKTMRKYTDGIVWSLLHNEKMRNRIKREIQRLESEEKQQQKPKLKPKEKHTPRGC